MRGGTRPTVWVVPGREQCRLGQALDRIAGVVRAAVGEGRVFVDGRRATSTAQRVGGGQRIEVYPPRVAGDPIQLLGEHDGIVAVHKPVGMPTEPDRRGSQFSVVVQLAAQLGVSPESLHAASRLDLGVSGVVLVARTAPARRALQSARQQDRLHHRYLAISVTSPEPLRGSWTTALTVRRRGSGQPGRAVTRYACVARADLAAAAVRVDAPGAAPALLVVEPVTGRTHQIRAHASRCGAALLGDRRYGGPVRLLRRDGEVHQVRRIALHAALVALTEGGGAWRVEAALPPALGELWCDLGGQAGDLQAALQEDWL